MVHAPAELLAEAIELTCRDLPLIEQLQADIAAEGVRRCSIDGLAKSLLDRQGNNSVGPPSE
jgi:hypothetical protein